MSVGINSNVNLDIHVDYRIIIIDIGKSEAINLLKNSDLSENSGSL